MTTIQVEEDRATIHTLSARFDVRITESGEISIHSPDGALEVLPVCDNRVGIRCVPWWNDETAIAIVEHMMHSEGTYRGRAEKIVKTLRGRINANKR